MEHLVPRRAPLVLSPPYVAHLPYISKSCPSHHRAEPRSQTYAERRSTQDSAGKEIQHCIGLKVARVGAIIIIKIWQGRNQKHILIRL